MTHPLASKSSAAACFAGDDLCLYVPLRLGATKRGVSADMSVAGPGRSHGTPGRCTSTSSPLVRMNTVPLFCSPNTSRSAGSGRGDSHFAGLADPRVAVDLDEDLSLKNREDLVGGVVAVKVSDVVGCNGLDAHDQTPQPVLGSSDDGDFGGSRRERHRSRLLVPGTRRAFRARYRPGTRPSSIGASSRDQAPRRDADVEGGGVLAFDRGHVEWASGVSAPGHGSVMETSSKRRWT
jgi:hypothetical protein